MAVEEHDLSGEESARTGWQRKLGSAGAIIVVIGLAGLIIMLAFSSNRRDTALVQQQHSFEVMIAVRAIEGQMATAEAMLGRAVIASDKSAGVQFYDEWRTAGFMIERLARITRDTPEQSALVSSLRALYQERNIPLQEAAVHLNYNQGLKALSTFYAAGKTDTSARTKAVFREIINNEQRTLAARSINAQGFVQQANRLAATLSALGIVLLVGLIGLGWAMFEAVQQRRGARRIAEVEALRAEALEAAVEDRTSELKHANQRLLAEASERAQAEAQLRQIQKMEAVGQLTGGIAHDFNNMLAVVVGGLELAKRKLHDRAKDAERHIDNAMEGANRAAALTRRLLAFARSEPLLPQSISPDTLLRGMTDLMDRTLGERISIDFTTVADLWHVWVDRHQLENAILNLAVNARDAMDGVGRLNFRTSNVSLGADEIGESRPGDYVRIEVTDTGAGMEQEVLERVFEPFFTTKPVGKGTGLGLSQIFGFVRQSGGEISIASTPEVGTTVSVYLPRYQGADVAATAEPETPQPALAAGRSMLASRVALIVEDDPRVRIATAGALEELGFETICNASAEEAKATLATGVKIDIVITDVVMPGMTGPELITEVGPIYPEMAVLFVTGYADVDDAEAFGGHSVLRKPFTISALETALDAALSAPPRAKATVAAG